MKQNQTTNLRKSTKKKLVAKMIENEWTFLSFSNGSVCAMFNRMKRELNFCSVPC